MFISVIFGPFDDFSKHYQCPLTNVILTKDRFPKREVFQKQMFCLLLKKRENILLYQEGGV